MSQQQFLMGVGGSHQQLHYPSLGHDQASAQHQGMAGGHHQNEAQSAMYADVNQKRMNTLATLQQHSGDGSSGEHLMMGQQMPPQFVAEDALLNMNDSELMAAGGPGSPGNALGMQGVPWMSGIASNQQIFNSPSYQTMSAALQNQSHMQNLAAVAGPPNPAMSSW